MTTPDDTTPRALLAAIPLARHSDRPSIVRVALLQRRRDASLRVACRLVSRVEGCVGFASRDGVTEIDVALVAGSAPLDPATVGARVAAAFEAIEREFDADWIPWSDVTRPNPVLDLRS